MRVSHSSQLTIPDLGLGCMGMSEFYGEANAIDCEATLTKAVEIGITHFDTADIYGLGENEKLIGKFLRKNKCREKVIIATKCGIKRDPNDLNARIIDNSEKYIYESCLKSIERLGTHIDLYYLHRIADAGKNIESSMNAMALLLREGKIKHVGISEANAEQIQRAHNAILKLTDGKQGLAAVQSEYSMMSRGAESDNTLNICKELGILFVAYSPISRGLLSGTMDNISSLSDNDLRKTFPRFQESALATNLKFVSAINSFVQKKDMTNAQLSLAWLLKKSPHVVPIPGTKRIKFLLENRAAIEKILTDQDMLEIEDILTKYPVVGSRYTDALIQKYNMKN